ncbi:hypothetical protein RRG08_014376 [Elysia crispata]|uniref:Uncharacterized protein n=1 Tax=Elysia crispata TaxID=231223 RepID=A0AAE0YN62_9GAST|nr:hypothetical protein RRG08_014376 [Elysia crispata]
MSLKARSTYWLSCGGPHQDRIYCRLNEFTAASPRDSSSPCRLGSIPRMPNDVRSCVIVTTLRLDFGNKKRPLDGEGHFSLYRLDNKGDVSARDSVDVDQCRASRSSLFQCLYRLDNEGDVSARDLVGVDQCRASRSILFQCLYRLDNEGDVSARDLVGVDQCRASRSSLFQSLYRLDNEGDSDISARDLVGVDQCRASRSILFQSLYRLDNEGDVSARDLVDVDQCRARASRSILFQCLYRLDNEGDVSARDLVGVDQCRARASRSILFQCLYRLDNEGDVSARDLVGVDQCRASRSSLFQSLYSVSDSNSIRLELWVLCAVKAGKYTAINDHFQASPSLDGAVDMTLCHSVMNYCPCRLSSVSNSGSLYDGHVISRPVQLLSESVSLSLFEDRCDRCVENDSNWSK